LEIFKKFFKKIHISLSRIYLLVSSQLLRLSPQLLERQD